MFKKKVCSCIEDCDCKAVFEDEQRNKSQFDEWQKELIEDDNRERFRSL